MFAPLMALADDDEHPTPIDAVTVYGLRGDESGAAMALADWFKGSLFTKASFPPLPIETVLEEQELGGCDELRGNPVRLPSGLKVEEETDFASDGEMGLFLTRTYGQRGGLFGSRWRSNFDYSLEWDEHGRGIRAVRPNGDVIWLPLVHGGWRQSPDKPLPRIEERSDGMFTLFNEAGGTEVYDRSGRIHVVKNAHGLQWYYTWADGRLQRVSHTSGRSVHFAWSDGALSQVTDPAGSVYRYTYHRVGLNAPRLASAILPGAPSTTISYDYQPSPWQGYALGQLTSKSFVGVRYSAFAYESTNENARAVSTEHAGGVDRHAFAYEGQIDSAHQPFTVVETNPRGHRTTRRYLEGRLISVEGAQSAHCPRRFREIQYDGRKQVERATDFAGNATAFAYDLAGRLTRKVEAAGTPIARTQTYAWAADRNDVIASALSGIGETTYTYTNNGRVASETTKDVATGATRKTTYAYTTHASGLLASMVVTGPKAGDARTFVYNATGDLVEARDGAGGVTKYSGHNGRGQPARIVGSTGAVNEFEYDARGRVVVERTFPSGTPVQKRYVYGASGLLDAIHTDDGNTVVYHYDAARRLIQEDMTEPGNTYSVRRITHDAMSQPIKVEIGRD
jgi:YD repeat-containing protein